jgi:hypothetical protein
MSATPGIEKGGSSVRLTILGSPPIAHDFAPAQQAHDNILLSDLAKNYAANPRAFLDAIIRIVGNDLEEGKPREASKRLNQLFAQPFIKKSDVEKWLRRPKNQEILFFWTIVEHWKNLQGT